MQETVAVPDPTIRGGLGFWQLRPLVGDSVRMMLPTKPFNAVVVIVDEADCPMSVGEGFDPVMLNVASGGPNGAKLSRHPHPIGLLLHWRAP